MPQTRTVKKSKGGVQDLLLGKGQVNQDRAGGTFAIDKLDVPVALDTIAEMQALEVTDFTRARVYASVTSFEDYIYDATDTTGISSDTGNGTWHRVANEVATIAKLRDLEPLADGQQVSLLGHTNAGMGGDPFYYDAYDTTTPDDNGTVIVTVGNKRWKRVVRDNSVIVEWFGVGNSAFTSALSIAKPGQIVKTTLDSYTLPSPIVHEFGRSQDGVFVEFLADFIFTSTNGFDFKDLQQGSITTGFVAHDQLEINDSVASTGVGVTLTSLWSCDVDIRGTHNFLVGSKLVGGDLNAVSGNGMAFNNIVIRNAKAPKTAGGTGCLVTTIPKDGNAGYFNENHLHIGFMRGETGLDIVKGSLQTDPFNGNKLIYPQVEDVGDVGIQLEFCRQNTILYPRFEGGNVPATWWVNEKSDCLRNDYYITATADSTLYNFAGILQNIFGRTVNASGGLIANQFWGGDDSSGDSNDHSLYMSLRRSANTPNNTVSFGGIPGNTRWQRYAGTVRDGTGVDKVFGLLDPHGHLQITGSSGLTIVPAGISTIEISTTGASDVTLQMPLDREINGMTVIMNLTFYTNQIEISKSTTGVTIPFGTITTAGLYMLVYRGDSWKVSQIGSKLLP